MNLKPGRKLKKWLTLVYQGLRIRLKAVRDAFYGNIKSILILLTYSFSVYYLEPNGSSHFFILPIILMLWIFESIAYNQNLTIESIQASIKELIDITLETQGDNSLEELQGEETQEGEIPSPEILGGNDHEYK